MAIQQIDHGTKQYEMAVQLRNEILRKPLGLTFTKEMLEEEKNDIHIAAFDDGLLLGCCMLTKISADTLRLRQMAVKNNVQGKGIGHAMLSFAETLARDKGYKYICMHARDTAVGFYQKWGYAIKGDMFLEVSIPHHLMEKKIS